MNKIDIIMNYLDQVIDNPVSELNYNKDYELLIAVVLSAQTPDKRVNQVTKTLFEKYDNLAKLCEAPIADIRLIIKSVGMYQKKAEFVHNITYDLLNKFNSTVPNNRKELESLSGVGRKTANVILSILFDEPYIAVDTHVSRVSKRLGLANQKDSVKVIEQKLYRLIPASKLLKMHHQLLLFGRYHCKAIKPECSNCGLINICKYKRD